jgi:hypothetical protein
MKPERILSRWGLLMVAERGPILAGHEGGGVYRTSTPLVSFDPDRGTGVTASGRPYRLIGGADRGYALMAFHSLWDAEVRVVSPDEAVALVEAKGNAPFRRTAEEQARIDRLKLQHFSREIRAQMMALGVDEAETARICRLTEDQFQGILDCDLSKISVDEADAAFVTLTRAASSRFGM